jgi:hypothetical protein
MNYFWADFCVKNPLDLQIFLEFWWHCTKFRETWPTKTDSILRNSNKQDSRGLRDHWDHNSELKSSLCGSQCHSMHPIKRFQRHCWICFHGLIETAESFSKMLCRIPRSHWNHGNWSRAYLIETAGTNPAVSLHPRKLILLFHWDRGIRTLQTIISVKTKSYANGPFKCL